MSVPGSDPKRTLVVADGDLHGGLREVRALVNLYGMKARYELLFFCFYFKHTSLTCFQIFFSNLNLVKLISLLCNDFKDNFLKFINYNNLIFLPSVSSASSLSPFTLQFEGHDAGGNNVTIRITRHYRTVMEAAFRVFPQDPYIILLEEDLYVASDFYR